MSTRALKPDCNQFFDLNFWRSEVCMLWCACVWPLPQNWRGIPNVSQEIRPHIACFCSGLGKCPNVSHHPTRKEKYHFQQIFVLVRWNKSPKRDMYQPLLFILIFPRSIPGNNHICYHLLELNPKDDHKFKSHKMREMSNPCCWWIFGSFHRTDLSPMAYNEEFRRMPVDKFSTRHGHHPPISKGVSINGGTPQSSILVVFSMIYHPFLGTPTSGNPHLTLCYWTCPFS